MERILILSANTGQGHNSCAVAIKEYCEKQGKYCEIRDTFSFGSKYMIPIVSSIHSFVYRRVPRLFGIIFRLGEKYSCVFSSKSPLYKFITHDKNRLHDYICENNFDTVICTHIFSGMLISDTLKKYPHGVNSAFVATDYCTYPSVKQIKTDRYFIADDSVADAYATSGAARDRIVASGIPIRRSMLTMHDKAEAKTDLGISPEHKHLLIMSGSMGCGPIQKTVLQLKTLLPEDITVSVICGHNKKLKKRLEKKLGVNTSIRIIGYTEQMSLYLDSADLYLTKPGGLSTAEAAYKHLPMLLVNTVSGCEAYNYRFFVEKGSAVLAENTRTLAKQCIDLLQNTERLGHMRNSYRKAEDAASRILIEMDSIGASQPIASKQIGEKQCQNF